MISEPDPAVDVLIHVADGVLYDGLDYAARIEERLSAAGLSSARCELTKLSREPVRSARAHILTGGATSVNCNVRWMRSAIGSARRLIAKADRGECSVTGICLGAQILAEALRPGSIVPAEAIEVGLIPVKRVSNRLIEQIVPSFHYQTISLEILSVPGTSIEWESTRTLVQAFRYGGRTFGYQFHPELTVTDARNLINYHRALIVQQHGDLANAHRSVRDNAAALSPDLFRRTVIDRLFD